METTTSPRALKRILSLILVLLQVLVFFPAQAASGYSTKILSIEPASLVGYWALDETGGVIALDSSGNNRHAYYFGTALSATTAPDGYPASYWDGINDQMQWDTSPVTGINAWNPDSGTLSFWFNFPSQTNYASLIWLDGTTGYSTDFLGIDYDPGASAILCYFARGGVGGTISFYPAPGVDEWHNITIVFDASSFTAYLDATSGGSQTLSAWTGGNLVSPRIYPGNEVHVARVALWSVPLSPDQVDMVASWSGIPEEDTKQYILLPSGQSGAIDFTISAGDILIASLLLLATVIILFRTVIKR